MFHFGYIYIIVYNAIILLLCDYLSKENVFIMVLVLENVFIFHLLPILLLRL